MCDPGSIALASLAVGVASAGTGAAASSADYAAKSSAWQQNVVNAEAGARDSDKQVIGNQLADQNKTNQQLQISQITGAEKSSKAAVSAVQGNVTGISMDNILQDIANKSEVNRTYADQQYKYIVAGTTEQLKSVNDEEQSRINGDTLPLSPSPLTPLIGIAGAGVNSATTYARLSAPAGSGASQGD